MNSKTKLLCEIALFVALVTVVTMYVRVPVTFTNGYKNLGDCIIFISSLFFNPLGCLLVGGIGSALADLLLGYTHYAIATFIIKGIEGFLVALIYQKVLKKKGKRLIPFLIGSVIAGLWMSGGYFLVNSLFLSDYYSALLGIPSNLIQSLVSIVAAGLLYLALIPILPKLKGK